jgi:hypothetical protein
MEHGRWGAAKAGNGYFKEDHMEPSLATCLSKEDKRAPAGCRDIISGRGQHDPLVEGHSEEP